MSDHYDIDRDIYELEEAQLKANLAMKEIDAKYRVKHMVLEASGQLTPEEFLALEEQDENQKSEDKKGVLQKLIETILEKIRNFLKLFKKDRAKWEDVKPDTEIETPVSEEDLRKYIKNGEVISEKLDNVLKAAQGSSLEEYEKAMREYEEATKDNAFMDSITSELVGNDIDKDTKKGVKRFMVKAGTITAALAVAKKLGEGFDAILSILNETVPGKAGKLFADMKIDKEVADKQTNRLAQAMRAGVQHVGSFRTMAENAYKSIGKEISKDRQSKNYEATRDEMFKQQDNVKGKADIKRVVFGKENNDGSTILDWINGPLHGNLNTLVGRTESRPKFSDIGAFTPYLFNNKLIMSKGSINAVVRDLVTPPKGLDPDLSKCYEIFKKRVSGDADSRPIFFDLWGIGYRKFLKIFDVYKEYEKLQRDLLKICNEYRKAIKKPEITWSEERAIDYLKIITTGSKNITNGNSWEQYIEDQGRSKKKPAAGAGSSGTATTAGQLDFINKCYKTMSYSDLFGSDGTGKKDGKLASIKAEDNHYWGFSADEVRLFATDRFKDKSINSFDDIIQSFKDHNGDIGSDLDDIVRLAKQWSTGNIMRWTRKRMEDFKKAANHEHKGSADKFINELHDAGWNDKYFIS